MEHCASLFAESGELICMGRSRKTDLTFFLQGADTFQTACEDNSVCC